MKTAKQLKKHLFSLERSYDQKFTMLENGVSLIAQGMPLNQNPTYKEKELIKHIETLINEFSLKLHQQMKDTLNNENGLWNEKFSILLQTLGKTENDLKKIQGKDFQTTWASISQMYQKSQLMFTDMKEDGIFYRIQSLWSLSELCFQQKKYHESWRHIIAGTKLLISSKPELPLTHNIAWNLANLIYNCALKLLTQEQLEILDKFHVTSQDILEYFYNLDNKDNHNKDLQKLRQWSNQLL
ncbi:MAG: hypothetical protein ACRCTQ_05835 [Brevinemataceae bacterium]